LVKAGLVEHTAKCSWTPSQRTLLLGFDLDLAQGMILVPEGKIAALKGQMARAIQAGRLRERQLASIISKIISMLNAVGPVSQLMTKGIKSLLNGRQYWCQSRTLTPEAVAELQFWLNQVDRINGREIWS